MDVNQWQFLSSRPSIFICFPVPTSDSHRGPGQDRAKVNESVRSAAHILPAGGGVNGEVLPPPLSCQFHFQVTWSNGVSLPQRSVSFSLTVMSKPRPIVFMDISIDEVPAGRIKMELFSDIVPKYAVSPTQAN